LTEGHGVARAAEVPLWRDPSRIGVVRDEIPTVVDVAVIGAGVIGLTAMEHLTSNGARAVLIEAGQPGGGSSTTGSGVVGWSRSLARPGEVDPRASGFPDLVAALNGAQDWFVDYIEDKNLDTDLVVPGSVSIHGPTDPGALGTVHPGQLVVSLVHQIRSTGGALAVDEPLRSISRHTKGFQILTSERKISAQAVIVATGAASGPHPLGELRKRYSIRQGRCLVVRSEPRALDGVVPIGGTSHTPRNRVIVIRRIDDARALVWYPNVGVTPVGPEQLLTTSLPDLPVDAVTHDWRDPYATTHDGIPRIGRMNAVWYAGGAADPALGALLGHHVAGLSIGTVGSSPFAEIPHSLAWTDRLRARLLRPRSAQSRLSG
jgi:glycine/D-amino acid oxidase-like deaminating enzyme